MVSMDCLEKKELQQKCTSTWDDYEIAMKKKPVILSKGIPRTIAPEFLRLYGNRLKASADLSRHLIRHRC
jgi:hypothetical protein